MSTVESFLLANSPFKSGEDITRLITVQKVDVSLSSDILQVAHKQFSTYTRGDISDEHFVWVECRPPALLTAKLTVFGRCLFEITLAFII